MLTEHLAHLDYLGEAVERVEAEIEQLLQVVTLKSLYSAAFLVLARTLRTLFWPRLAGYLNRFPSARHLASWAGLCPGNNESAGKRYSGKTRKGSPYLRTVLVEAAHAAARTKNTYLAAQYRRIAARRGRKRAAVALAHTLLTIIYHILKRKEPYHDLGANYFDERDRQAVETRLVGRLCKLGYTIDLQPIVSPS